MLHSLSMRTRLSFVIVLFFSLLAMMSNTSTYASEIDHLKRINTTHKLRVCIWPDYYGITFRNPKTQQLNGIDIENAHDLAKELGATVEFIDSSFTRLVDDVTSDRCDIAMFAIGITPSRQKKLRFTQPHLASDIYAITAKVNRRIKSWDDIDKAGTVVVVAKGTLHEPVMKAKLKAAELRIVDTPAAREQEVQSGRADVFITDYPFSRRMLDSSDWAKLVSPPATYHVTPYGWAMKFGDDRFHARVESVLAGMKRDGRLMNNAKRNGLDTIVAK